MDDNNVIPFTPQAPRAAGGKRVPKFKKGSPEAAEHMRNLTRIRLEKIANGELEPNGHRPKGSGAGRLKPITAKEIRDRAVQTAADLFDDARQTAVDKLITQMNHKDPSIAQRAAVKILEYTDGKPNQPVTARTENITKVIYETAAIMPQTFTPGYGLEDDEAAESSA